MSQVRGRMKRSECGETVALGQQAWVPVSVSLPLVSHP